MSIKKYFAPVPLVLSGALSANACPVCERQQPKLLRGIVHGAGPEGQWDYWIIGACVLVTLFALFYSVKWLLRPGERSPHHIKRSILNQESYE